MVSAAVFSDLLEMAEHLLKEGYAVPAASLARAVLEDGLRRIASKHEVTVKKDDDLGALSHKLVQGKVFNDLLCKRIQAWIAVRNSADHGHFDEVKEDDVKQMIEGVGGVLADHL